jgi:sigma-B regulation protein RsbU (phosphoserine phosphatase)
MLEQIFIALFPGNPPSRNARRAWTAALLLSPVALVSGFLLLMHNTAPTAVPVTTDLTSETRIAKNFLLAQGVRIEGLETSSTYNTGNNVLDFANENRQRQRVWQVAPPVFGIVTFHDPARDRIAQVFVSVDGKVVGYDWKKLASKTAELSDAEAVSLASSRLPSGFRFSAPQMEKENRPDERMIRVYTFNAPDIPDAKLKTVVEVDGANVTSLRSTVTQNDDAKTAGNSWFQTTLTLAGILFVCLVALFSIYRYTSRTLQQEVSHSRSLLVCLLCGCFCVVLALNAVVNEKTGPVPLVAIGLTFAVLGLLGGALLAAAYGSGEGDVREAFPGKLTSLDALLTANVFSVNVGAAVLLGMTLAGWLVLAAGLGGLPFRVTEPQGSVNMIGPMMRFGWMMPFVIYPLMALSFSAAGLLQPLAFLQRYVRARRWHLPVLLLCAGLVSTLRAHARSDGEFLLTSAILVVALLGPFYRLDLLATMVCLTAVFAAQGIAGSYASAPAFTGLSLQLHIAVGVATTFFGLLCITRGKTLTEEQVRPLYAKHIAERKSLEAEVSAAREAQLRLLPDCVPEFAGLHISAACIPAETVGGDFYDFFPLGDGRLGIFIAEGNNQGLAAALNIALAKGYLMQAVERFRDPVELLTHLELALASIFEAGGAATAPDVAGFAFAVIDTNTGELRFARTGAYPKVVLVSERREEVPERLVPVRGRTDPMAEGCAHLAAGDHLVLFTDGIGRRMSQANRKPEEFITKLIRDFVSKQGLWFAAGRSDQADAIREHCFEATRESTEPDDLTLVVIHVRSDAQQETRAAWGVVA